MSWWSRHECSLPVNAPVVEDQRFWTCPECGKTWEWTELEGGVGWAKR